jgi:nucleoside 2-deoxyribosyltransferase
MMMMMNKVYLSGPITGLTYQQARYTWREEFANMVAPNVIVLSPMRHEGHLAEMGKTGIRPDNLPTHLFSHPKMIVAKDFLDIDESTIVVVNLLGATAVSQGTLVEYGYAYAKGKTIITISDNEAANPHNSPFIPVVSNVMVETLRDAALIVNSFLSTGV